MTSGNANLAGRIRYVGGNNCTTSSNNANVAGRIRCAGCYVADAGDRINNSLTGHKQTLHPHDILRFVLVQERFYAAITTNLTRPHQRLPAEFYVLDFPPTGYCLDRL